MAHKPYPRPMRSMGLFGAALMPLNGMIGAGIFALPAVLQGAVGGFAPWMMLLGGILFLPLIVVFAALSRQFDHSGGPALYGHAAFGPFVGFQAGWTRLASGVAGCAANAHVVVSYAAVLWPAIEGPAARPLAVVLFQLFFVAVNLAGMRRSVSALGLLTLVKLAPLAALVGAGIAQGASDAGLVLPRFGDAETVVLLTFYAFMGFEVATMPAGEMKQPRRDIPRAMIATLAMVTALYMVVTWAYVAILPEGAPEGGRVPLALAGQEAFGRLGAAAIVVAAAFSVGGNTLSGLVNVPRLMFGMAEQGMLPAWFRHVSPRTLAPDHSILFVGAASIALSLTGGFLVLATAGTLLRLVSYLVCSAALPVVRMRGARSGGSAIRPFELAMAALAFVACAWIATRADARAWLTLAAIMGGGGALYLAARWTGKNSVTNLS